MRDGCIDGVLGRPHAEVFAEFDEHHSTMVATLNTILRMEALEKG